MRILHIISQLGGGGAERLVAQIAPLMNSNDSECAVLVLSDRDAVYIDTLIDSGVSVFVAPYQSINDVRLLRYIRKIIRQHGYDVVHAHLTQAIYWTSLAANLLGERCFVATLHGFPQSAYKSRWWGYINKRIFKRYDAIIAVSEAMQSEYVKHLAPPSKQIGKYLTIDNGVPIEELRDAAPISRAELGVPDDVILLCMVGRFTEQKNHKNMISALSGLHSGIQLVLVGDGVLRKSIEKQVAEEGLGGRVRFMGFRMDVVRIMKSSDICVLPSISEQFGLVAVEAMACGKALACSDVPGLREVVGDSGLLFDPNDPGDIAEKINELINDETVRSRLVARGLRRAEEFGVEKMVERHMELYGRLCKISCQ